MIIVLSIDIFSLFLKSEFLLLIDSVSTYIILGLMLVFYVVEVQL